MKYKGSPSFSHEQEDKIGVLITNLGTPAAPTTGALRRYLHQFLSDPRVVEAPRALWWFILNGIILRIRPARSAKAYRSVWTDRGSPLLLHTQDQEEALAERLAEQLGNDILVRFAMRYGEPSIDSGINHLLEEGARKLLVLPLYPQYSASTTGSTFDALARDFMQRRWLPELRFVTGYQDFPPYIRACAVQIQNYWKEHGKPDLILFSYHGVPQRYLHAGDPYYCHCEKTSRLLATELGLGEGEFLTTYQSRFGREPWLQPYTDETLKSLPPDGIRSVHVFCPGFSADCLETLEEIAVENRDYFLGAGGESYHYIPALNAQPHHIDALAQLVTTNLAGWDFGERDLEERWARATSRGARA